MAYQFDPYSAGLTGMSQDEVIAYLMSQLAGSGSYTDPAGAQYQYSDPGTGTTQQILTGYQQQLTPSFDPNFAGGEYGSYIAGYDPSGKLQGVNFQKDERHNGFLGENLDWLGPLLVGGAAGLGWMSGLSGGGAGVAGGLNGGFGLAGIDAIPTAGGFGGGAMGGFPLAGIDAIAPVTGGATAAGGGAGAAAKTAGALGGWGDIISSLAKVGTGIYGAIQGEKLEDRAAQMDPWGEIGGRKASAQQLLQLMANPEMISSVPGYQSGLQAVTRSNAAQGYQGSGKMATDLAAYGGNFYTNYMNQLAGLAGAGVKTDPMQALQGIGGAQQTLGNSLGLLSEGFGSILKTPQAESAWKWATT